MNMSLRQLVGRNLMEPSFSLPLLLSRSLKPFSWRHECNGEAKVRGLISPTSLILYILDYHYSLRSLTDYNIYLSGSQGLKPRHPIKLISTANQDQSIVILKGMRHETDEAKRHCSRACNRNMICSEHYLNYNNFCHSFSPLSLLAKMPPFPVISIAETKYA